MSGRSSDFPSWGQRAAIARYSWLALAPAPLRESFGGVLEHAEHHRALIDRFWRFPHRTAFSGAKTHPPRRRGGARAGCGSVSEGRALPGSLDLDGHPHPGMNTALKMMGAL